MVNFYRGDIFYIYRDEVTGSEQEGGRPAIIVSNDVGNEFSKVVEVVWLTTRDKKPLPTHVAINSAKYPSTALCEQIETVSKDRIGNYVNSISSNELKEMERAMMVSLGIDVNVKAGKFLKKWGEMIEQDAEDLNVPESVEKEIEEKPEVAEKVQEVVSEKPAIMLEEVIRVTAERDVYRDLYMSLLEKKGA